MSRPTRQATCHPDKKHLALGLCRACYNRALYTTNPAPGKEQVRRWRVNHPEAGRVRRWRDQNIPITTIQYQAMLEAQHGLCAICTNPPGKRRLAPDHNHKTGKLRLLLCYACNLGIGHLQDDSALCRKAADYLDKTN